MPLEVPPHWDLMVHHQSFKGLSQRAVAQRRHLMLAVAQVQTMLQQYQKQAMQALLAKDMQAAIQQTQMPVIA